jgi:hypothetical protein
MEAFWRLKRGSVDQWSQIRILTRIKVKNRIRISIKVKSWIRIRILNHGFETMDVFSGELEAWK